MRKRKERFVKSVIAIDRMLLGFCELKIQRLRHKVQRIEKYTFVQNGFTILEGNI